MVNLTPMAVTKQTLIRLLLIDIDCLLAIIPISILYEYHYTNKLFVFKYSDVTLCGAILISLLGITIVSLSKKFNTLFWTLIATSWFFYLILFVLI